MATIESIPLESVMKMAERGIEEEIRKRIRAIICANIQPVIDRMAEEAAREMFGHASIVANKSFADQKIEIFVSFGERH